MIRQPDLIAISIADSALDVAGMRGDLGKYLAERDPALVKELPGQKCTRFTVADIPGSLFWNYVMAAPEGSQIRVFRAFQYGVRKIEHIKRVDGSTADTVFPDMQGADVQRTPYWSEEQVYSIPPAYVSEIGGLAYARGFFSGDTPRSWPVPPSSLEVLAHRMQRLVGEIRDSLDASSAKPSDDAQTPSAPE